SEDIVWSMKLTTTLFVLLSAAVLEAGGDAIVRAGIHASSLMVRTLLFVAGGLILFSYGWVVNAPPWDFGRLLGVYVVFFFLVAQVIAWAVFHQPPATTTWIGGALILAGGAVVAWR